MTLGKRLFDIFLALGVSLILFPVFVGIICVLWCREGRPLFYVSERMKTPTRSFLLLKFYTMKGCAGDTGVSGGHKDNRITSTGRYLRKTRLDELPQLWNVLKGDISFVGPRPPLRQYVAQYPELYGRVLKSRPGITGLATVTYHAHEERLLSLCSTAEETHALYGRVCVPRKAHLDLIYQKRRSFCLDLWLIARTVTKFCGR